VPTCSLGKGDYETRESRENEADSISCSWVRLAIRGFALILRRVVLEYGDLPTRGQHDKLVLWQTQAGGFRGRRHRESGLSCSRSPPRSC
jgi:hypothetical protein